MDTINERIDKLRDDVNGRIDKLNGRIDKLTDNVNAAFDSRARIQVAAKNWKERLSQALLVIVVALTLLMLYRSTRG